MQRNTAYKSRTVIPSKWQRKANRPMVLLFKRIMITLTTRYIRAAKYLTAFTCPLMEASPSVSLEAFWFLSNKCLIEALVMAL